jgi:hypothetical protein
MTTVARSRSMRSPFPKFDRGLSGATPPSYLSALDGTVGTEILEGQPTLFDALLNDLKAVRKGK